MGREPWGREGGVGASTEGHAMKGPLNLIDCILFALGH